MPQAKGIIRANICLDLRQLSIALVFLLGPVAASHAVTSAEGGGDSESETNSERTHEQTAFFEYPAEPYNTGWALVLDNDAVFSSFGDEDYTGGFSVALEGSRAKEYRLSLDPALTWVNEKLQLDGGRHPSTIEHLMQFGLTIFTPDLGSAGDADVDDRPFANLLYLENSQFSVDALGKRAYQTTLTVGVLGTDAGEIVQDAIHDIGGNTKAPHSGKEISDGGELTARYAVSMQSLLHSRLTNRDKRLELKVRVEGGIGFITEGSATLAARWGKAESPWWSFAPTRSNYVPQLASNPQNKLGRSDKRDFFLWCAVTIRARAYNAFLQGQFRDSEKTYTGGELNHILGDLSVGINKGFGNAIDASLSLHYQTDEIKNNSRSRDLRWGGLTIRKSF